jgi:predicted glycogen debranching enzyme
MSWLDAVNITLDAQALCSDETALRREWLVANGLGGYASASVATANTRRYHGLLVAALNPPVGRAVLLSKLEATLEIVGADGGASPTFALSSNLYPGVIYPQGHRLLESWAAYPAPTWVWSPMPGVRFEKRVWMAHGRNTSYISYRLREAPGGSVARLHLVPLIAWKNYHAEMHATAQVADLFWFPVMPVTVGETDSPHGLLRVTLPAIWQIRDTPTTLNLSIQREDGAPYPEATFAAQPYWYYHFQHPREQERGLDFDEDLYALGMFSASLKVGESLTIVASVEAEPPAPPEAAWREMTERRSARVAAAGPEDVFGQRLALAADTFLVQAPGVRATVIAGYPWFCDWGRDTMIALPGLCLATGQAELAREILLAFADFVDQGMLPNRFPDIGSTPEYNTVDATLWYFAALFHYVEATGDSALLQGALWSVLEEIVRWHQQGTRYAIHVDPEDHLLSAGQGGVQLTWMDARVGDWVVTPRIGKPVEINALWVNALRTMASFAARLGDAEAETRYTALAKATSDSFAARFARPDGHGLYDVLDTPDQNRPDAAVRPNQVFALSLPFAPLDPQAPEARALLQVVQEELWTPFGLRTLSPHDPCYRPRYGGDQAQRDGTYHQGTAWPWLLGPYAEAHYKVCGDRSAALALLQPLQDQLSAFGVGSLAEIYDGEAPQQPNGCIAQAWSVAETLRVWKWLFREERDDG